MRSRLIVLTALMSGCGAAASQSGDAPIAQANTKPDKQAEETPPTTPAAGPQHALLVANAAALPECTAEAQGWLIYVKADKEFRTCAAGKWEPIEIEGEAGKAGKDGVIGAPGEDGAAGATGPAGPQGPSGTNKIQGSILCSGTLDATSVTVSYSVAVMTSGDVFATAQVGGTLFEASGTRFYSSQQVGAATASVLIRNDLAGATNAGYWDVRLDRTTLVVTAQYNDADLTGGQQTWSMTPDQCVVNSY